MTSKKYYQKQLVQWISIFHNNYINGFNLLNSAFQSFYFLFIYFLKYQMVLLLFFRICIKFENVSDNIKLKMDTLLILKHLYHFVVQYIGQKLLSLSEVFFRFFFKPD